jgi:hypothetical protein
MASLKLILGLIPSTSKIEQAEKALITEFEKLRTFAGSDQLARYNELNSLVNSADFIRKRKEIESLQYKHSTEWAQEKEFVSLQKAKDIVLCLKTAGGSDLKKFKALEGSDKIKSFEALEKFIQSAAFKEKQKMKPVTFKDTEEYKKFAEYISLKKEKEIKRFLKIQERGEIVKTKSIQKFEELDDFINTPGFASKKDLNKSEFKKTAEYSKFIEYKSLKKSREVRDYLKSLENPIDLKSKKILRYKELLAFVGTPEFRAKQNMKPITFKDTEEFKKFQEYKNQKDSSEIKEYYSFLGSKEYSNYLATNGSKRLASYNELKGYVASKEFIDQKAYLLDKKRFEKTTMFKEAAEYDKLKKNADIIWYFKTRDSARFDILKGRDMTFHEEFEGNNLDTSKWLTNYYWGEKLLGDRYSVESDLQAYTEKENFEIRNSVLKIHTKPQKIKGKVWAAGKGFSNKEFGYSSGLINTGNSFRQKYGLFTAKIKLGDASARSAFWMIGDRITPHVDICRTSDGKVWFDYFSAKGNKAKTSLGSRYSGDFYIYTLEWTKESLVWKINNTEVFRQTSDVPQEPMYISLAGGVSKPLNGSTIMEIDWVRVYQPK